MAPMAKESQLSDMSLIATSTSFAEAASAVIGMANKNEKREAASRLSPSSNPAVIVAPER